MTTSGHERMSSVDTAWLRMDGPDSTMMIVGVSVTETPIRPDDFRRMIEQRLLCFPRFRRRVAADALGASWVDDDAFDLDAHLVRVALPRAGRQGRVAGAGLPARERGARSAATDVAGPPGRALRARQRVDHPRAPLLRGRHRHDPRAAVHDGTGFRARPRPPPGPPVATAGRPARARLAAAPARCRRATSSRTRSPRARGCSRAACTSSSTRGGRPRSPATWAGWPASSSGCSRCPTIPSRRCAEP